MVFLEAGRQGAREGTPHWESRHQFRAGTVQEACAVLIYNPRRGLAIAASSQSRNPWKFLQMSPSNLDSDNSERKMAFACAYL